MGLIGVLFVELFQYWQIVDNAWIELLKLLGFTVFLLAIGTLPYVDNMAHIGILYLSRPQTPSCERGSGDFHVISWLC